MCFVWITVCFLWVKSIKSYNPISPTGHRAVISSTIPNFKSLFYQKIKMFAVIINFYIVYS